MRSGAQILMLLSTPLATAVLASLREGSKQQVDLRREAGSPAQTTLRAQLSGLEEIDAVERQRTSAFPGAVSHSLTDSGYDLLVVVDTLEHWLRERSLELSSIEAKATIRALAESWSTSMLRALATSSLSLTELDRVIGSLSYPSIERRLAAMRLAGLAKPQRSSGRGTPYQLTEWTRRGIAPLVAASRWERQRLPETTTPVGTRDIETIFLLALPALRLPDSLSGCCRIGVEIGGGESTGIAGVQLLANEGRIVSISTRLDGRPDAWAIGSLSGWFSSLIENKRDGLELGGHSSLAAALVGELHDYLFGGAIHKSP